MHCVYWASVAAMKEILFFVVCLQALCGSSCRLEEIPSLTDAMYCILERVGRSRYNGEITPGPSGLIKVRAFSEIDSVAH